MLTPNDTGSRPVEPKPSLVRDSSATPSGAHKRKAHNSVDEERYWKSSRTSNWLSEQKAVVHEEQYLSAGSAAAAPIELAESHQSSGPVSSTRELQVAKDVGPVPNNDAQEDMHDTRAVRNRADEKRAANRPFTHFSTGELARARDERMLLTQALVLTVTTSYEMFHNLSSVSKSLVAGLIEKQEFVPAAMQKFYSERFVQQLSVPDRVVLQFAIQTERIARDFCLAEGDAFETYCQAVISGNRRLRRELRHAYYTALNPKKVYD